MKSKGWIYNPPVDLAFIFFGVITMTTLITLQSRAFEQLVTIGIVALALRIIYSPSHFVAPILLLIFNKTERLRILSRSPNYYKVCLGIIATNLILFGSATFLYAQQLQFEHVYIPIAIIGGAYYIWNGWHFATQQFGIIQIYRSISNLKHPNRKLEFIFCILILFVLPIPFIFAAGLRDHFFTYHFGKFVWSWESQIFSGIIALIIAYLVFQIFRIKRLINIQIALSYLQIILLGAFICISPGVLSLLVFSLSHWIQEIFLVSLIHSRSQENSKLSKSFFPILLNFVSLIFSGLVVAIIFHKMPIFSENKVTVFGQFQGMFELSPLGFSFAALMSALFMSIAFIHFYTDKLIYAGRKWNTSL